MPEKKKWDAHQAGKIIRQDWNVLSGYDDEPENAKFYQLTDRQSAALQAVATFLGWATRYLNLPGDVDIGVFADDTVYRLQNPIDPGECVTFAPFASFITYEPNDPYRTPDLVPDGYVFPPWYVAGTAAEITYDAQLNAAVTTFERMPALTPLSGFPRFRVTVNGIGKVTLHFAAVNIGGMVQITRDDDITTIELIDLIQDKIAVPPETANIIEKEYTFAVAGEHRIDCIMLPAVQDSIPPVMFGGGLAGVTLCGFGLHMAEEGILLRQSPEDSCILEQSNDGETWSEAFDFSQCASIASGDDVTNITIQNKIVQYAAQQRQSAQAQAEYEAEYTGDPSSINPDAPDDNFDGGGTDDEKIALCGALMALVHAIAYAKVQQLDVIFAAGAGALALAAFLTGGLAFGLAIAANVAISGAALVGGVGYVAARNALTNIDALNDVACCMRDFLLSLPISQANWDDSLGACGFTPGSNAAIVRDFMAAVLHDNYLTFCDLLGEANKSIEDEIPVDCSCIPLELEIMAGADCLGNGVNKGSFVFVSGDEYDLTLEADPSPGDTVHFHDAHNQLFCYQLISGTVISSAVRDSGGNCDFSGIGFGATGQNEQIKECSLYDVVAKTVRIKFYRDPV